MAFTLRPPEERRRRLFGSSLFIIEIASIRKSAALILKER